jgi:hypothetical protein
MKASNIARLADFVLAGYDFFDIEGEATWRG